VDQKTFSEVKNALRKTLYTSIVSLRLFSTVFKTSCPAIKFEKLIIRIHMSNVTRDINAIKAICIELVQTPKIWYHGSHHHMKLSGGKPPAQRLKNIMSANPPIRSRFTVVVNPIDTFRSFLVLFDANQYTNPNINFQHHGHLISYKALSWSIEEHAEGKVRWMFSWQRCRRCVR